MEEPKDVRDYETIDHKKLKQWGESAPQFENTIHLGNVSCYSTYAHVTNWSHCDNKFTHLVSIQGQPVLSTNVYS